ncbi:MAG: glycine cleavage system protein GcvH [Pseudonocardiaceae bacterium]
MVPEELRYTENHEWASPRGEAIVRVGITDYAQSQLGDVVHVQPPEVGEPVEAGDPVGEVESTKSVSEVFAPVSGEVVAFNSALEGNPELVNSDPYGEGWMIEIKLAEPGALDSLMTAEDYRALTEQA